MQTNYPRTAHQEIAEIAARHLGIEELEEQRSDSLDFHEVAVWDVRAALDAAYTAGRASVSSGSSS
jgi:hypothetical protein